MENTLNGYGQLSAAERFQLVWALFWPCAVFGIVQMAAQALWKSLGLSHEQVVSFAFLLLQLLLFSPWVIRRTVRLHFPGFQLLVVRRGSGEETRDMNYLESLSVAWLIIWRAAAIGALILLVVLIAVVIAAATGLHVHSIASSTTELFSFGTTGVLSEVAAVPLELLVFFLYVAKAAVAKQYERFSLRIDRVPEFAIAAATS